MVHLAEEVLLRTDLAAYMSRLNYQYQSIGGQQVNVATDPVNMPDPI